MAARTRDDGGGATATASTMSDMEAALAMLQPIRDLSRNWDVDIASCLEEYLHELAHLAPTGVTIRADTGATSAHPNDNDHGGDDGAAAVASANVVPNFAHAALILQNSSNVYGRKVEYLHGLVHKALQEIFKSAYSQGNNNNNRRSKKLDADVEEFYEFDPHEDFLLLDDVIPEDLSESKKKINLPMSTILREDGSSRRYSSASMTGGGGGTGGASIDRSLMHNQSQLSLGAMSVTRLDRSAAVASGFGPSSSSSSPAQQRALLGILNSGDLRLVDRECDVGADGTLLIPGSSQQSTSSGTYLRQSLGGGNEAAAGRRSLFGDQAVVVLPGTDIVAGGTGIGDGDVDMEDAGMQPHHDNGDDDDDGPGFVMNDYGDDDDARQPIDDVARQAAQSKRVTFAPNTSTAPSNKAKKTKADPWALLNPHSADDTVCARKPLRKGRTYRLPEGVELPPSECVTGSSTTRVAQQKAVSWNKPELRPSLAVESFRIAMGKQLAPSYDTWSSKQPFKDLVFGDEFLYVAKENARKRAAKRRAERKERIQSSDVAGGCGLQEDGARATIDEDEDDYGSGFDFAGSGNDYDDDEDYGNNGRGNAGFGSLDEAFQTANGDGNHGSNAGQTFEELCQAHIQAFAKGAEKFALNTKLSERVNKWQARLAPLLEEEERRAAFDIRQYSEVLIESALKGLEQNKKRKSDGSTQPSNDDRLVDFDMVTEGRTKSDVCRLFLASLSLANSGNLAIEDSDDTTQNQFRFQLLSNELHQPMEDYRAPSLVAGSAT